MKNATFWLIPHIGSVLFVSSAAAHVTLTSPTGGESFDVGQTVEIQRRLDIAHDQVDWELYFSPDNCASWETARLDMPVSQRSYSWTVPDLETQTALIRIVQDNRDFDYRPTSRTFSIGTTVFSAEQSGPLPPQFSMSPNYPNPFNPGTISSYELPRPAETVLLVYNVVGQEVVRLVDGVLSPGYHQTIWDGRDRTGRQVVSGIYIVRLTTPGWSQTIKMVLLK